MSSPTSDRALARVRRETADAVVDLVVDARADGPAADAVLAAAAGAERAADVLDGVLAGCRLSAAPAFAIVEWPADAPVRVTVHGALLAIALPAGSGAPVLVDGAASRSLVERELPGAVEVLVAPRAEGTALLRLRREEAGGADAAAGAPGASLAPVDVAPAAAQPAPALVDAVCADTIVPFTMPVEADREAEAVEAAADAAEPDAVAEAEADGAAPGGTAPADEAVEETTVPPAAEDAPPAPGPSVPPIGLFAPTQLLGAIQGLLVDPERPGRRLDELDGAPGPNAGTSAAGARPGTGEPSSRGAGPAAARGEAAAATDAPASRPAPAADRLVDPEAPTEVLDATILGGIVPGLRASARAAAGAGGTTAGETTAGGTRERPPAQASPFPSGPEGPSAPRPESPPASGAASGAPAPAPDPVAERPLPAPAPAPAAGSPAEASADDRFIVIGPDGRRHEITGAAIFGRAPRAVFSASDTTLVEITDAVDISRNHVRIASEAGVIVVTDLHSRNGTDIVVPGRAPQRLRGGEAVPILEGTVVDLGSGVRLTVRR